MNDILFQPLGDPIAAGESLEHIADIDPRMIRTHYFDGRLLTAEDLERDQIYLDQRLREIGKVLGTGIINGLELSFDRFSGLLTLQPGQAMTPLGRVLHLSTRLLVNLGNRALISQLNQSKYRKFNRALYAVVLRYVDVATDIAEVFPTDLASKRGSDYALVTESVQMGLAPLPTPLPQQDPIYIRAGLIREFLGNSIFQSLIPEDSVALGVIAIQNDTPQWLDSELLRHPIRRERGATDLQEDLSRQYEALLEDVFSARLAGGLNNRFAASDYFSLLPPVGTAPKDAFDAVNGHQLYFPENFNVHIAPIRLSDIELIKAESLYLPNIDLNSLENTDIVVLAPLTNQDYGLYASQLERNYDPVSRRLPQLDLLRLKLYPVHPVHQLDTDANVWQAIWNTIAEGQLLYIRRPVRAAETAISSIVLALGSSMPQTPAIEETASVTPTTTSPTITPIEDEDSVFLRFINFKSLAEIRPPQGSDAEQALERLIEAHGDNAPAVRSATEFLVRVERQYDALIWQTLEQLVEREATATLLEQLREAEPDIQSTGKIIVEAGTGIGLSNELLNGWKNRVDNLG